MLDAASPGRPKTVGPAPATALLAETVLATPVLRKAKDSVAPASVTPRVPPPRLTLADAVATLTPEVGPRSARPNDPVTVSPPAANFPSTAAGAAAPSAAPKNAVTPATSEARRP